MSSRIQNLLLDQEDMLSNAQGRKPKGLNHGEWPGIPPDSYLLVTTNSHVYAWSEAHISPIFRSKYDDIVASSKIKDVGTLFIAESGAITSQHREQGYEKNYRLKRGQGQMRHLLSGKDSEPVFFTTSLQNTVQTYSVHLSRIIDPAYITLPSQPDCLAISPSSHLMLSASAKPRTILLHNLTLRTSPLVLCPTATSAEVVVTAFHPERPSIFLLAFEDGTVSIYDASRMLRTRGRGEGQRESAEACKEGELGYVKHVQSAVTKAAMENDTNLKRESIDRGDGKNPTLKAGEKAVNVTAAEFIPGTRATVISVRADGGCQLVDFENPVKGEGHIIRTWHIRGPATSISVSQPPSPTNSKSLYGVKNASERRNQRPEKVCKANARMSLIAIGRIDGKVFLFDLSGKQLAEKTVDEKGRRIINVEWISGRLEQKSRGDQSKLTATVEGRKGKSMRGAANGAESPDRTKRRKLNSDMLGSDDDENIVSAGGNFQEAEGPTGMEDQHALPGHIMAWTAKNTLENAIAPYESNFMNLFSPVKKTGVTPGTTANSEKSQSQGDVELRRKGNITLETNDHTTHQEETKSSSSVTERPETQTFPSPSRTRKGSRKISPGKSPRSRVGRDNHFPPPAAGVKENGRVLAELRNLNKVHLPDKPAKGLALFAPYMQNKRVIKQSSNETSNFNPSSNSHTSGEINKAEEARDEALDIWLADVSEDTARPQRPERRGVVSSKSKEESSVPSKSRETKVKPKTSRKTVTFIQDAPAAAGGGEEDLPDQEKRVAMPGHKISQDKIIAQGLPSNHPTQPSATPPPLKASHLLQPSSNAPPNLPHGQDHEPSSTSLSTSNPDPLNIIGKPRDLCRCECPHHVLSTLLEREVSKIRQELRQEMEVWQEEVLKRLESRVGGTIENVDGRGRLGECSTDEEVI
ncbi:MAG: hypothetical protein M1837_001121 [Sclerophora amabilis]|nr:MAG: hypothetical protein M1837_001121 [Sclerophora amabilis]